MNAIFFEFEYKQHTTNLPITSVFKIHSHAMVPLNICLVEMLPVRRKHVTIKQSVNCFFVCYYLIFINKKTKIRDVCEIQIYTYISHLFSTLLTEELGF